IAKDYIGIASGIGTSTELYVYPDSVRFGTPTHPVRVSGTAGIYPNDFVTLGQIRDSLGASSTTWSNVTSKPQIIQDITSGDAGLVNRLSISRPVQQQFVGDLNTVLTTGIGHVFASGSSNLPVEHNGTLYTGYHTGAVNGGATQIFVSTQSSGNMYFRRRHPNGTWYDWQRVLTEPNAASLYLPLTGGDLTGNLSGTTAEFTGTVSGAQAVNGS